jgi:hypothetical protein
MFKSINTNLIYFLKVFFCVNYINMKSVNFNMNIVTFVLLVVVLVLVVVCFMKKKQENFRSKKGQRRLWGWPWWHGRVGGSHDELRCWRQSGRGGGNGPSAQGLKTDKNKRCVSTFTECLGWGGEHDLSWKGGVLKNKGKNKCWRRGKISQGEVQYHGIETSNINKGCVRTFTGCLALDSAAEKPESTRVDLTPALYKEGYEAYKNATHIPDYAFCQVEGNDLCSGGQAFDDNVVLGDLGDLSNLVSIGKGAFNSFAGKLTITSNAFPALVEIGAGAFYGASNKDSEVELIDMTHLVSIGKRAFYGFKGKVTLTGKFPALTKIDQFAFQSASNTASEVSFTELAARSLHWNVFDTFSGRLALTPTLYKLGERAYKKATHIPDYAFCQVRNELCSVGHAFKGDVVLGNLPLLVSIGNHAFNFFAGKLTITNNTFPALVEIGDGAFSGASNKNSEVELINMTHLVSIGEDAFAMFVGKVTMTGNFPALAKIGQQAFYSASNPASSVLIYCNGGELNVGEKAFENLGGQNSPPASEVMSGCLIGS